MLESATEIIELAHASTASPDLDYSPVFISTDRRAAPGQPTTLGYFQVGGPKAVDKIGNTYGPIYMVEFVDVPASSYIKIWGLDNNDANAPVYPTDYLIDNPKMFVWLKKFEWTDVAGDPVTAPMSYKIFGHRKRTLPTVY
jgi:hypothetical protein